MQRRRTARTALSAVLTVSLTAVPAVSLTACGTTVRHTGTATRLPSPSGALAAAVARSSDVNLRLVLAGARPEGDLRGVFDSATGMARFTQSAGGETMQITVSDADLYLAGLDDLGGKTMHLDVTRLPVTSPMALFADPVAALALLSAATGVQTTGAGAFQGTIDLAKVPATGPGTGAFLAYVTRAAQARAGAVAFRATVDGQGRLARFTATFPGLDQGRDGEYDVTVVEYGGPVSVTRPAGESVIEAPPSAYRP